MIKHIFSVWNASTVHPVSVLLCRIGNSNNGFLELAVVFSHFFIHCYIWRWARGRTHMLFPSGFLVSPEACHLHSFLNAAYKHCMRTADIRIVLSTNRWPVLLLFACNCSFEWLHTNRTSNWPWMQTKCNQGQHFCDFLAAQNCPLCMQP